MHISLTREQRERIRWLRIEELRRDVALGIEEADRGDVAPLDIDDIKRRVHDQLAQMRRQR